MPLAKPRGLVCIKKHTPNDCTITGVYNQHKDECIFCYIMTRPLMRSGDHKPIAAPRKPKEGGG